MSNKTLVRGLSAAAILAILTGAAYGATTTDESGKTPNAWLRFDGNWDWAANTGVLSWDNGERADSFAESPAGKAMQTVNNSTHPYGSVSNLGSTWTISTTIKAAVPSDGKFEPVYHFGGSANGWGIGVRKVEGNADACEVVFGKAPFNADSLLIKKTIEDGCSAYHTYTVTFENGTLTMYVDGETAEGDSKTGVTLTTGRNNYQLGGVHGGHNTTNQSRISGLLMDDFRVYKSILTTDEIKAIATGKYALNASNKIATVTAGVVPVDITVDMKTIAVSEGAAVIQSVSGGAAKYDWTYNTVSLRSVGTATDEMGRDTTQGFDGALADCFKYAEDDNTKVTALYTATLAYQDMSIPANFSAAISCTIPPLENGIVMAFGSNNNNNGVIAIAAGAPTTNEDGSTTENMKLVYIPRNATAAQVQTLATMAVPNGQTAAHLLVFTKEGSAMKIYMDGKLATTATLNVSPSGGFQMGSVHGGTYGGYKASGRANLSGDALYTSYIKTIRVYDGILSATAMAELVKEFPYTSPSGSSAIEVSGTADWVSSSGTPWTITAQDGSTSEAETAKPGSSVTVTAAADTTVTVNVAADVAYEAMTVDGSGKVTFVKGEGAGALKPTTTTIKTPVIVGEATLDLTGGPVTIEEGGSIAFDFTALTEVTRETALDLPVTGLIAEDDTKVTLLKADTVTVADGCVFELRYNEANQCYHVYAGKINADGKLYWDPSKGNDWTTGAKALAHDKDGNPVEVTIHDDDTVVFGESMTSVVFIKGDAYKTAKKIEIASGTVKFGHDGDVYNFPAGSTVTVAEGAKLVLQAWDNAGQSNTKVNLADTTFNGPGTVEVADWITTVKVDGNIAGTAKLVIPEGAVATVASNKTIANTIGGAGTIKLTTMQSFTKADDWTGTVDLGSIALANDTWYDSVGKAGSTVKFDSFSGHLPANNSVVAPTLEFGSMTITGGYNGHTGTYNKIKGTGAFANTLSLPNQGLYTIKIGDVSEFTGTLTIGNDGALELPNDAEVTVVGATAKVVGETTTIYYPSNADALAGKTPGDDVSNVTILSGSLPAAWDGYKVDADGNIVVMDNYTITVEVENATVAGLPESMTVREDNAEISFTVTPDEGYVVTEVKIGETTLEAVEGTYTTTLEGDATITVTTEVSAPTVPTATVTKLTEDVPADIDAAYVFAAGEEVEGYSDYEANFEVSFSKAIAKDSVVLKGSYGAYLWQQINMPKALEAGDVWTLLPEGQVHYSDVVAMQTFTCGVKNYAEENVGATMTVKLVLSNEEGDRHEITTTTYELTLKSEDTTIADQTVTDDTPVETIVPAAQAEKLIAAGVKAPAIVAWAKATGSTVLVGKEIDLEAFALNCSPSAKQQTVEDEVPSIDMTELAKGNLTAAVKAISDKYPLATVQLVEATLPEGTVTTAKLYKLVISLKN